MISSRVVRGEISPHDLLGVWTLRFFGTTDGPSIFAGRIRRNVVAHSSSLPTAGCQASNSLSPRLPGAVYLPRPPATADKQLCRQQCRSRRERTVLSRRKSLEVSDGPRLRHDQILLVEIRRFTGRGIPHHSLSLYPDLSSASQSQILQLAGGSSRPRPVCARNRIIFAKIIVPTRN